MILIISRSQIENTTENIIDWLSYFKAPFYRFNSDELENGKLFNLELSNDNLKNNTSFIFNGDLDPTEVKVVWNRRGSQNEGLIPLLNIPSVLTHTIHRHLRNELDSSKKSFFSIFQNIKWIDNPNVLRINKIEVLNIAKTVGFDIPNSLVTNSLNSLKKFYIENDSNIITKCISDGTNLGIENFYFGMETKKVEENDIINAPKYFSPSFFQKNISKKYELRVFYLDSKCYSMAIFSQNDSKTQIDFRNYNLKRPNRFVPYNLPLIIQSKVKLLMNALNLTSGSIDLITTIDNQFIFLEVNPVGQFGMVSFPCNYFIERDLAKKLIYYSDEKT